VNSRHSVLILGVLPSRAVKHRVEFSQISSAAARGVTVRLVRYKSGFSDLADIVYSTHIAIP
jgi:hypothetical protein